MKPKASSTDRAKAELCKCGKNPATPQPHRCPYQYEINDDASESCNCCGECSYECAMDT